VPNAPNLRPATRDELTLSLSFGLGFNGWKRVHGVDDVMARIIAERIAEHLERLGYLVMHKPPLGQHGPPANLAGGIEKATTTDRGESLDVLLALLCSQRAKPLRQLESNLKVTNPEGKHI
jgi:hypothetical protein